MRAFRIAEVFGVPIHVHVTLLLLLPILALNIAYTVRVSFLLGLVGATAFFGSIALHELGHTLVALRKGCRVRRILLLPIGGMAQLERLPVHPRDEFEVALAGPLVSLALAVMIRVFARALGAVVSPGPIRLLYILSNVNFMLAFFNLLPSFPMDGGRIFRAWLSPALGRLLATRIAAGVGRFIAVVMGIVGLLRLDLLLVFIAIFIYQAAAAEYRHVWLEETAMRPAWFEPPVAASEPVWPEEVIVSPPPYERRDFRRYVRRPLSIQRDWFDELFEGWR